MIAIVIMAVTTAATGAISTSADVAAQPIEEKASAKVAMREDVWRRRNWLRFACTRNQSWIAVADPAAIITAEAVTEACNGARIASAATSGAKSTQIEISTTSILARITREGDRGAVATRSAASSPETVSQPRPPASWPAAITIIGVINTSAVDESEKLRHRNSAGGTR